MNFTIEYNINNVLLKFDCTKHKNSFLLAGFIKDELLQNYVFSSLTKNEWVNLETNNRITNDNIRHFICNDLTDYSQNKICDISWELQAYETNIIEFENLQKELRNWTAMVILLRNGDFYLDVIKYLHKL